VTDELGQAATLPHRRAAAPAVTAEATPIAEREGPAPTTPPPDAAPAPPRAEADDLIPFGTMLGGRYEVRGHLGSGGMGTVYAARDCLMELPVALKFVRPQLATDPREQSRLWREVRLAQAITHVNVVRTYTLERQGGHLFIVMELLDGVSLADRLREGPLPLDEVVRITRDVLAGLSAAHARNIVHRDVKPQNTRICADGRVVVMDRTNGRYLRPEAFAVSPERATIDVSFISLEKVLPAVFGVLAPGAEPLGEVVALVKPQFEVGRGAVGKGGVVRDGEQHREVLTRLARFVVLHRWHVRDVTVSPLRGPKGNREFFLHLTAGGRTATDLEERVARATEEAGV